MFQVRVRSVLFVSCALFDCLLRAGSLFRVGDSGVLCGGVLGVCICVAAVVLVAVFIGLARARSGLSCVPLMCWFAKAWCVRCVVMLALALCLRVRALVCPSLSCVGVFLFLIVCIVLPWYIVPGTCWRACANLSFCFAPVHPF